MNTPQITGVQGSLFENFPKEHPAQKKKEIESCVFNMMDALRSPILTFSPHWKDTIPQRILDKIPMARMIALFKSEEMATLEECCAYMYTRSLEAPMEHEWTDIFTHVCCRTLERWFNENRWEETRAPKELSAWLQSKLDGLRRHIYVKRREILKQQLRNQKKNE